MESYHSICFSLIYCSVNSSVRYAIIGIISRLLAIATSTTVSYEAIIRILSYQMGVVIRYIILAHIAAPEENTELVTILIAIIMAALLTVAR